MRWWALVFACGCGLEPQWHSTLTVQGTISVVVPLETEAPAAAERCVRACPPGENAVRGACLATCPGAVTELGACTLDDQPPHAACTAWFDDKTVVRDGRCDATTAELTSQRWRQPGQARDARPAITCAEHRDMTLGGKVVAVILLGLLGLIGLVGLAA